MNTTSLILSTGSYLPERVVTNVELEATLDTNDAWIRERTGIQQRHIAAKGELTSDLATKAANVALERAGLGAQDIDILIVATTTPDETIPATATRVQHKLGMKSGAAFDINAACSGFIYGLTVADGLLKNGGGKRALVIGAEIFSRVLDWQDRNTCILFGDGAGAVVLEAAPENGRGIRQCRIHSDGTYGDLLMTGSGVATDGLAGTLKMQGKEVYKHAVSKMSGSVCESLERAGLTLSDVDLLIPHQANKRIMAGVAEKLELSPEKVISTVELHANTSAASIPLAMHHADKQGLLLEKKCLALTALGAGLTWGSCIIVW